MMLNVNDQHNDRHCVLTRARRSFAIVPSVSQVLAVGDCMLEACFVLPDSESHAPDVALTDCVFACGGSAANFACTLGRLGQPVGLLSHLGDDMFSGMLMSDLLAHHVDTRTVTQVAGSSSVTAIIIEPGGERRFLSFRSPAEPDPAATRPEDALAGVDWLHISGFVFQRPATAARARDLMAFARRAGISVSCDPSPLLAHYAQRDDRDFWSSFDVMFPNEYEASALTGQPDMSQAALALLEMGVRTAAVTVGASGCLVASNGDLIHLPARPVASVRDTTGAGDAFAAGFVTGVRHGFDLPTAAGLGNLLAAHAIRVIGGHGGAKCCADLLADPMPDNVRDLLLAINGSPLPNPMKQSNP